MTETRKRTEGARQAVLTLVIGSLIYAVGFRVFIEPSGLILGGATGVATLLDGLFSIPIGIGIMLVNLPLFAASVIRHGLKATSRMASGVLASSLFLDLLPISHPLSLSPMLSALLGGGVTAVGIAFLLYEDFTTGGSELAAILIQERFSLLTVGKTVLLIDSAIVLSSAFLLGRTDSLFYSALLNLIFSVTLDLVYSTSSAKKD